MFNAITVDRSLFFIDETRVDDFKSVANSLKSYYELNLHGALENDDVWTTAFNLWLLLHPDEMLILEAVEKTFYYSSDYIVYSYLKDNYHFKFIRNYPNLTKELGFLFSIHLTNMLNQYWLKLLLENNLEEIVYRNKHQSYFDAHKKDYHNIELFLADQAHFIKILVQDIKNTTHFADIVKSCSKQALHDYEILCKKELIS